MRIRHLRLRVNTEAGMHGADLAFEDGLNVLWADNSMGKSTCVRSMIYALGLDATLTTSHVDVPLPPAMKAKIETSDGSEIAVVESEVYLEIENAQGKRITIQRTIKGERNIHLVTVWDGAALSLPSESFASSDYFVAYQNAAIHERGFHQFLASFVGWNLPEVATFDGRRVPLYVECMFPFLMVEQTKGWSSLLPAVPTQYRIREVHKRAIEFLLDLDAYRLASQRVELLERQNHIAKRWNILVDEANVLATGVSGVCRDVPAAPVASWPPEITPVIVISVGDKWPVLQTAIAGLEDRLSVLRDEHIPRVEEIASAAGASLSEAESLLRGREARMARILSQLELEQAEADEVRIRIRSIEEDLQRNKDVQTLQKMGSRITKSLDTGICPTCHQSIQDTLAPLEEGIKVMPIEDNISFLEEQRRTFVAVQANTRRVVEARQAQLSGLRMEASQLRSQIRALRQTLISDGRLPSAAAIEERIRLDRSVEEMKKASEHFSRIYSEMGELASRWADVRAKMATLPKGDTSERDRDKLKTFADIFRDELNQFGFRSVQSPDVYLSPDTYRPEYDGFDLQNSVSASDLIRAIWAYLHGLLETSRTCKTNHLGFLIFDEPRQQSTRDRSFRELLQRVAISKKFRQQVIFATSEKVENLQQLLQGLPHKYIGVDGRVLKPLTTHDKRA